MKVLQVSKFYPPDAGGIETAAFELTEGLNRAGLHSDVLCVHHGRGATRERAVAGYRIDRLPVRATVLSLPIAPGLVGALARQAPDYDVLHIHMPNPLAALAVWWVRPTARIVLHWHSDVIRQRRAMRLYAPLERWLLRRASAVVATSMAYAQASAALRPWLDKVTVVPIGIADPAARLDAGRLAQVRARHAGHRLVVAVGRQTGYKGFDVLIDALARLPDDVHAVVIGAGELLEAHRQQVLRLGLGHRVDFPGPLADGELLAHIAAADVFCLPSTTRAEAYGVVLLEAMALGRPIVASDIAGSGVPWIVGPDQVGRCVPPGDALALSVALRDLLAVPEQGRALGTAGRRRYESDFRVETMTRRMSDLYRRILPP